MMPNAAVEIGPDSAEQPGVIESKQMQEPLNLLSLTQAELVELFAQRGEPAFRARQVFAGLHQRRLQSFEAMTDLPKALRAQLGATALASGLTIESRYLSTDGTRRFLMKTRDNRPVETVFIPEERR